MIVLDVMKVDTKRNHHMIGLGLGAVHKLCQRPKGVGGVWKMLTMADKGGRVGKANADNE